MRGEQAGGFARVLGQPPRKPGAARGFFRQRFDFVARDSLHCGAGQAALGSAQSSARARANSSGYGAF